MGEDKIGLHRDSWIESTDDEKNCSKNVTERRESVAFTRDPKYKKTIVLDLDQTLLHGTKDKNKVEEYDFETDGRYPRYVKVRPGVHEFLDSIPEDWEVIVWTASSAQLAEKVIPGLFKHHHQWRVRSRKQTRQYRFKILSHQQCAGNVWVKHECEYRNKPLYLLNVKGTRPLKTCILVDNAARNVYTPPLDSKECWPKDALNAPETEQDNYIAIPTRRNDNPRDDHLAEITELIKKLKDVDDVRPLIRKRFNMEKRLADVKDDWDPILFRKDT